MSILHHQFALITESVEALRTTQVASGIAISGLFEGLVQRAFAREFGK
jgi:hypothetical protein